MSDLNVAVSPTGLVGLDNEKSQKEAINNNKTVAPSEQINKINVTEKAEEAPKEASPKEVSLALEEVSAFVQSMQRNLSFSIDEQSGEEIISVTDAETQEVIRQIPSEELVVLRKKMDDVVGILFDTKV
ncbi:flagellar biosynthesis protein FlaG [Psychromonas sp. psych-6C06]|uniref:flagellar protein FlaG n=1 Tax=Psychromonas sp. psych-6C06 TaxID=2058089 RepID=UPI000C335C78|nr:flagellar protein FlaG [Psychromonas sp. psych-6C06]PKF62901.1 flagellar biosynthesis protein FlaG [Psychromonas sp. psych-6C06]